MGKDKDAAKRQGYADGKAGNERDPHITKDSFNKGAAIGTVLLGPAGTIIGGLIGESVKTREELSGEDRKDYNRSYDEAKRK